MRVPKPGRAPTSQATPCPRPAQPCRAGSCRNLHAHFSMRVPKSRRAEPCHAGSCLSESCRALPRRAVLSRAQPRLESVRRPFDLRTHAKSCPALPSRAKPRLESVCRPFGLHTHAAPRHTSLRPAVPSRAKHRHAKQGPALPRHALTSHAAPRQTQRSLAECESARAPFDARAQAVRCRAAQSRAGPSRAGPGQVPPGQASRNLCADLSICTPMSCQARTCIALSRPAEPCRGQHRSALPR